MHAGILSNVGKACNWLLVHEQHAKALLQTQLHGAARLRRFGVMSMCTKLQEELQAGVAVAHHLPICTRTGPCRALRSPCELHHLTNYMHRSVIHGAARPRRAAQGRCSAVNNDSRAARTTGTQHQIAIEDQRKIACNKPKRFERND
jgi:hypothetical protein